MVAGGVFGGDLVGLWAVFWAEARKVERYVLVHADAFFRKSVFMGTNGAASLCGI